MLMMGGSEELCEAYFKEEICGHMYLTMNSLDSELP